MSPDRVIPTPREKSHAVVRQRRAAVCLTATGMSLANRSELLCAPVSNGRAIVPIDVDTTRAPGILIFTIRDEWPPLDDLLEMRARLVTAGHLTAETRALVDVRHVTPASCGKTTQGLHCGMPDDLPLVRGYLVASVEQFGFAQQLQAVAPPGPRVEIFTDEGNALRWLGEPHAVTLRPKPDRRKS